MEALNKPANWVAHKLYTVVFEDIFSFAIATRKDVPLTDEQYTIALRQMKNRQLVVNRFDKVNHIQEQLIIKSITLQS